MATRLQKNISKVYMKGKNPAYKNVNTNSMKFGGCKCGCARQTTSNIPDPTKMKPKKRIIEYKRKPIKIIA
jgi:hypothetical protein